MHVGGDDMIDLVRRNAERGEPFANGVDDLALTLFRAGLIEAGIADEGAVRPLDHPDVVADRRHLVVRVAENVVFRSLARVLGVADRVNLVDVVAHDASPALPTVTPARRSIG